MKGMHYHSQKSSWNDKPQTWVTTEWTLNLLVAEHIFSQNFCYSPTKILRYGYIFWWHPFYISSPFTTFLWQTNTCVNRTTNEASNTKTLLAEKSFRLGLLSKLKRNPWTSEVSSIFGKHRFFRRLCGKRFGKHAKHPNHFACILKNIYAYTNKNMYLVYLHDVTIIENEVWSEVTWDWQLLGWFYLI